MIHFQRIKIFYLSLLLIVVVLAGSVAWATIDPFPVFDSIRPNVTFWQKVYSEHTTNNGYIHDANDLSIIYEVIDLVDRDQRGARKKNKKRIKKSKARYKQILTRLARGKLPATAEEKRVLALFGPDPDQKKIKKAREAIRFQLCQRDRFLPGLQRSGAYLHEMKEIFRSYDLPVDLAYLPHVESSFNYKAYSKFGAAGVWQFTRGTGKRFMNVGYALDERRDPIRATYAAARFLKENYKKLGSWPLALTAYNHGPNAMMRAKKKNGSYEQILKEYKSKRFGFASRNFYAEFIAAREIAKNYQRYFGEVRFDSPQQSNELEMAGFADIKDLSRHFAVDLETIRELNPALRKPVFQGRKYVPKGYRLRLPTRLNGDFDHLVASMSSKFYKKKQKRSRFYRVETGDTAGQIARRHRVRLADLILANNLNSRATIYVGQNLRIPTLDEKIVQIALSAGEPLILASLVKSPPFLAQSGKMKVVEKNIKMPKTLPKVAQPHKPLIPVVAEVKKMKPVTVKAPVQKKETETFAKRVQSVLQAAVVEGPSEEGPDAVEVKEQRMDEINPAVVVGNLQVLQISREGTVETGVIRVEPGETLGHYSDWLSIPTQKIRRLNGFLFGRSIKLGQEVKIPLGSVSRENFEEKRYEYHKEVEEDFFIAYVVDGVKAYRIKAGDTVWDLCYKEFDLPFWLIKRYNGSADLSSLRPGQEMTVPVVVDRAGQEFEG